MICTSEENTTQIKIYPRSCLAIKKITFSINWTFHLYGKGILKLFVNIGVGVYMCKNEMYDKHEQIFGLITGITSFMKLDSI